MKAAKMAEAEAISNFKDFLTFVSRKSKCENIDQFFRNGTMSSTADLFEVGKYFLNHALGIEENDFFPNLKYKEFAFYVPQSENYYPWALFVVPTNCEDLAEFFDHHGRDYLLSADSGKKDFVVVTNLKNVSVFDPRHYLEKYEVSFSDLYDGVRESEKRWKAFLQDFGPEKVKDKKKARRKEVVEYHKPNESSPELQYVKRFGHMPSFEIPIGYDGKNFRETFKTEKELPFLTTEVIDWDRQTKKNFNKLIWGDNLSVMRSLPDNSIDLIYVDPPFFSGRNYNCIFGDDDEVRSFKDIWDGGLPTYLAWLNARLWEMKRLLKPTGSLFIHLDWHAAHYVKCELDKIFGYENFINEIAWCYKSGGASKSSFSKKHDAILFYGKSNDYFFNCVKEKSYMGLDYSTGNKNVKLYDDNDGKGKYTLVNPKDWWEIGMLATSSKERIGYPTQKPEQLIEKIITAACPEGGVVADFFSGGGTTITVAEKLGRRWLGCDISRIAVSVARDRLLEAYDKGTGIECKSSKPKYGFQVDYHGVYERDLIRELEPNAYTEFILKCYQATVSTKAETIHGFRDGKAVFVAPANKNLKNHHIDSFCADLVEHKIQNGVILSWNVSKESEKYISDLKKGSFGVDIQIIQIKLVDIDSNEFKGENIRFINKPAALIRKSHKSGLTWIFDATASCGSNGSSIHCYQWDFDYKNKFSPKTKRKFKGDSDGDGNPMNDYKKIEYTFPSEGTYKVAVRIFDKAGAESIAEASVTVTRSKSQVA